MGKTSVIFLVGPTAIGKSEIGVCLAKEIGAEIISCDSMQIYRGMDIITSKPAQGLRRRIPHHLIDAVSPRKDYDVSQYAQAAGAKIKEIIRKEKIPLFVGGTGFYMSILLDGIFQLKAKRGIREQLYTLARKYGNTYLHDKLKQVDPEAAERIHPHDTKRIVRALEVFESTGEKISALQKKRKGIADAYDLKIFCLDMQRAALYNRIDQRVERMFKQGLADEVRKLLALKMSKTAYYAIGIRELENYFKGLYDLDEAKRLIKSNSRQYAKRQLTWFRKDKRIEWVGVTDSERPLSVAKRITKLLEEKPLGCKD